MRSVPHDSVGGTTRRGAPRTQSNAAFPTEVDETTHFEDGSVKESMRKVDGNVVTKTTSAYDARRRLVTSTVLGGGTTTYTLDQNGNRTEVSDPLTHKTYFKFDQADRQTQVKDHSLQVLSQVDYDENDMRDTVWRPDPVTGQLYGEQSSSPRPRATSMRRPKAGSSWPRSTRAGSRPVGCSKSSGAVEAHRAYLAHRGYSGHTVRGLGHMVRAFLRLSGLSEKTPLVEVTPQVAERAMAKLLSRYGPGTAWRYATGWMKLFRGFTAAGLILENPFGKLACLKRPRLLPGAVLSIEEIERVFKAANLDLPSGVRNRAILETFYSTGIRLSEMAGLAMRDVDFGRGTLVVRCGKGGKARVVPLGEAAMEWLRRYLKTVRPRWADKGEDALWIGQEGRPISSNRIQIIVRRTGRKAKIGKPVTPHTLRRTCATHLLSGGASAWAVKGILGHADMKTLGRYVSLKARELREMHEKTHPRA